MSLSKSAIHSQQTPKSLVAMSSAFITSSGRPSSRSYDTGFPESFDGRTTCLRHPDANTAPGAFITAEDIDPARALHRQRRSFLSNKYKRTISYGKITPEQPHLHKSTSPLESIDSAIDMHYAKAAFSSENPERTSKDGTDSISRTEGSLNGDYSPVSPASSRFDQKAESPRRKNLFSKWRSHRD